MIYYLKYYLKKFWVFIVLVLTILLLLFIFKMNNKDLIKTFNQYFNKVDFEPQGVITKEIEDKQLLSDIIAGLPYIGDATFKYIPSNIPENERAYYLSQLNKNPDYMYMKNINWSSGQITNDQYKELVELVGYHLNKNSGDTNYIVETPSPEELEKRDLQLNYYTDEDGILYLNIYVTEVTDDSEVTKEYIYTFQLKYDMNGKVVIK